MDLYVLDTDFEAVTVLDVYESFIWTDRYQEYGDFELYTLASTELLTNVQQDYYIINLESEHAMIVEKIQIETDVEDGNHVTISGRSLESILDRRVVWKQKTLSGKIQTCIKTLLTENFISPSVSARKISNFTFEETDDESIAAITIDAQYTGDNIYDVIVALAQTYGFGFKVVFDDDYNFVFSLYWGTDRSYDQEENPYVVFSPNFENIINSNYIESKESLKNVALIGGEGEGSDRTYTTTGSGSGLSRRELFTDARDISSEETDDDGETVTLSDSEYKALLVERGEEDLAENTEVTSFEGEMDTTGSFVYGTDFFNGDIVQVVDEYGHEERARILEIVTSEDESGCSTYPTFSVISEDEDEDS